jgi:polyphosphate kinase
MSGSDPRASRSILSLFEDPALFLDRDLSLIEFQRRVFNEARDESNPILERVKFLSIVVRNFDEFEMVRMPQIAEESGAAHFEKLRSEIVQAMREVRSYLRNRSSQRLRDMEFTF